MKTETANDIVFRLNFAMNKALEKPRVREAIEKMAAEPAGGTPAESANFSDPDWSLEQGREGIRYQDAPMSGNWIKAQHRRAD